MSEAGLLITWTFNVWATLSRSTFSFGEGEVLSGIFSCLRKTLVWDFLLYSLDSSLSAISFFYILIPEINSASSRFIDSCLSNRNALPSLLNSLTNLIDSSFVSSNFVSSNSSNSLFNSVWACSRTFSIKLRCFFSLN